VRICLGSFPRILKMIISFLNPHPLQLSSLSHSLFNTLLSIKQPSKCHTKQSKPSAALRLRKTTRRTPYGSSLTGLSLPAIQTLIYYLQLCSKVYDVTEFVDAHPGGEFVLKQVAGTDATEAFYNLHKQEVLQKFSSLCIGSIEGEKSQIIEHNIGDLSVVVCTMKLVCS